ncbi:putative FAD-linked oxidoreductase [Seiridium unicorne]|uniref:FAD-linked oxidoreductase n=1 Tax=Seiridium unicorne TaxID=138068 RepID=A0ABR2UWZ4_9PEZI
MLFSKGSLGWAFFLASVTSLSPLGSAQDLDISQLNTTVDGRLKLSRPLAEPCYGASDGRGCEALKQSIGSAWARSDVYQGFQYMQGESCISDPNDQCVIDYRTLTVPPAAQCGQGVVSPYFVEVAGASDAQAVFQYARSSGATLSIKNSGHDYVMRSSRNGSIALWTRQLRDMAFSSSFTPEGCSEGDPGAAVTIGAGVDTDEAMTFAHANGVLFTGGSAGTLVDYVTSQGGDVVWTTHDSYFGYYQQYINGTFTTGAIVSTAEFVTSRVVPADIFGDTTARSTMIDGIFEIASTGVTPMLLTVTPYLYAHNNEGATNETNMLHELPLAASLAMSATYFIMGRTSEQGARTMVSATGLGPDGHGKFWTNDAYPPPSELLASERGTSLYKETWNEALDIFRKHLGPDVV